MSNKGDERSKNGAHGAPIIVERTPCVFLAGDPGRRDLHANADTLVRLGLLSRRDGAARNPTPLFFGQCALQMWDGEAARDHFAAAPDAGIAAISIGGAPITVGEDEPLLALMLRDPVAPGERLAHLQAIQQLFAAAAIIAGHSGATRLYWPPARLWSPTAPLASAITSLEKLNLPPILHLIGFVRVEGSLQSVGLAEFCGIEIALRHDGRLSEAELVRRISRLVIHAMVTGPLQAGAVVAGLAPDEIMTVGQPSSADPPILPIRLSHEV